MYIQNYSCLTAAGVGTPALMEALHSGKDCSIAGATGGRVCYLNQDPKKIHSYSDIFVKAFKDLIIPLREGLSKEAYADLTKGRVVLIFASNKGALEDYIWKAKPETIRDMPDPYFEILKHFQENAIGMEWVFDCSVGNSCISSYAAIEYAQDLFENARAEYALIISGELIGPFLEKGFQSLNLLSHTKCSPFAENRDGLQLGEAMAMMLLSRERKTPQDIKIQGVVTKTHGTPVFPPDVDSQALLGVIQDLHARAPLSPDLVVAYGAGTKTADAAEDAALSSFLESVGDSKAPITSITWCVGNSEGARGLIDLITACEVLKSQEVFKIQNTEKTASEMRGQYLLPSSDLKSVSKIRQVLLTSLAFTGIYAACAVGVTREENGNTN